MEARNGWVAGLLLARKVEVASSNGQSDVDALQKYAKVIRGQKC